MRPTVQLALLLLLSFLATPAGALPAPMSEQELMEKSDVVAVVRVLSVTCTAVTKDKSTGENLPHYLAQVKVVEVKKGEVKPGAIILVTWRAIPKEIVGPWTVDYYPGEEVLTHLVKNRGGVTYNSTWWNAKGEDLKAPATTDLPTKPGQSILPPREAPAPRIPL